MSPKLFRVKKLMHGYVSIRDYVVMNCMAKNRGILVEYGGEKMLLTPQELISKRQQFHGISFTSKFDSRSYQLYDYKFTPEGKPKPEEQMDLFLTPPPVEGK